MAKVVLDTDVLIDHLGGKSSLSAVFSGSSYSVVSRAELYSWTQADEAIIDRLLEQFEEVPVNRVVAEEAGRIRRESGLRLPDALIAATALHAKRPLFTRNLRDFRKVKRLRLHLSGNRPTK
ncbi:MAG: type II toxin-antitoxin system VapC family toxin [Actinomycetota bacterium]|nr:type II toxin-antitoxin system VapC family toxin [Actinomycetota bacterium]